MKIIMTAIICCVILTFVAFFSIARAENFYSDAISDVSKIITIGKSTNEDKNKPQVERTIYVSSSLSGIIENGSHQGVGMISGLAAFGSSEIYNMASRTTIYGIGQYVAKVYGHVGMQIYSVGTMTIGTVFQAVGTFSKTAGYVGKSMQIMNPPTYLNQKTSWGWRGEGSYSIPGGYGYYQETLRTAGPGPITRTHTDWFTTNTGTSFRQVVIKTPAESFIERYMIYHYPVGDYFDPYKTNISTTTISRHWVTSSPTFNATWKTAQMGPSVIKYSSIDWNSSSKTNWSIHNTTPSPTYIPSMPSTTYYRSPNILFSTKSPISTYTTPTYRTPTYTPRMPSSLGVRRY